MTESPRLAALVLLSLFAPALLGAALGGCGGAEERRTIVPVEAPERTAAANDDLRRLLVGLAERQLCDQMQGTYIALPDEDSAEGIAGGASPSAGRMWIESCHAERRDDRLAMRLEGPGWTWVERESEGPMGSSFQVRGHLRFRGVMELEGTVDVAYTENAGVLSLWLTPGRGISATITPTGSVPVAPQGGWSSFLAGIGGVFGDDIEERAKPIVEEQGSEMLKEVLAGGFTFTLDVCSGQSDSMVGALANGDKPERPYPPDEMRWLANQRVRMRAGGLDVAGPFQSSDAPVHLDFEVEAGPGVELRMMCAADAEHVVAAHLEGRAVGESVRPVTTQRITSGTSTFLEVDSSDCPMVAVMTPMGATVENTIFRFRAFVVGDRAEPLVNCDG